MNTLNYCLLAASLANLAFLAWDAWDMRVLKTTTVLVLPEGCTLISDDEGSVLSVREGSPEPGSTVILPPGLGVHYEEPR
jgi:hypothetical protein